jgi:hypothetical protein
MHNSAATFFWLNNCPFTKSAYLRVLNAIESCRLQHKYDTVSTSNVRSTPLWSAVPHKSPSSLLKEAELHRILASNNLDGKDGTTDFSNLVRLAKMDANSCSSVLQELMPLLPMFSDGFKAALVSAMWQIIESVKSDDLTYMAGTTICQILDHGDYAAKSKSDTFEKLKVTSVNISPSVTESTLRLWSKYAGRYLKQLSVSSEQLAAIDQNLTQLRLLLDEDMVGWL